MQVVLSEVNGRRERKLASLNHRNSIEMLEKKHELEQRRPHHNIHKDNLNRINERLDNIEKRTNIYAKTNMNPDEESTYPKPGDAGDE